MVFKNALTLYKHPRVLAILCLSFASGLPFLLILSTLSVRLLEAGYNKSTLGLFALATTPYSLKFLWAPVLDFMALPGPFKRLGQRRGWLLLSQMCLMLAIVFLGALNPEKHLMLTFVAALVVGFCAATQDIVVEAYRIEATRGPLEGIAAGASSFGFRGGLWVSGAGALYLGSHAPWVWVYGIMASLVFIGVVATLLTPEPRISPTEIVTKGLNPSQKTLSKKTSPWLFMRNAAKALWHQPSIMGIFCFILTFKVGDTVLHTMTTPFLLDIGFSKVDIAHVANSFGIFAAMAGGAAGGLLLTHFRLISVLKLSAFMQIMASLMFMFQARLGHNMVWLMVAIGVENIACGLGMAAFVVFLSRRCCVPYTGSHFAFLISFGSLCRVALSMVASSMADTMTWDIFYLLTAFLCIPCLLILGFFPHLFEKIEKDEKALSTRS